MKFLLVFGLVAAVALHLPSPQLAEQFPRDKSVDSATCSRCSVRRSLIARLSAGNRDDAIPGVPISVAVRSSGEIIIGFERANVPLSVFDRRGRFQRHIGRAGAGPGEWRQIQTVYATAGDSLRVVDIGNHRVTALSPRDSVMRTSPFMLFPYDLHMVDDGTFVANWLSGEPSRAGLPLHVGSPTGTIRSFGNSGTFRLDREFLYERRVALASNGTMWAAHRFNPVLENWSLNGKPIQRIVRRVSWFTLGDQRRRTWAAPKQPPEPNIIEIFEENGFLWVFITVASTDFEAALGRPRAGEGGLTVYPVQDVARLFDTIVEVYDVSRSELLTSQRFPEWMLHYAGRGRVASYREDTLGEPVIEIWQLSLSGASRR